MTFDSQTAGGRMTPPPASTSLRARCTLRSRFEIVPTIQEELRRRAAGTIERSNEQFAQVCRTWIGIDQCDARSFRTGEQSSRCVRRVIQFTHCSHHDVACGAANIAAAVHHARNRHWGNARLSSHFVNGDCTAFAASRLLHGTSSSARCPCAHTTGASFCLLGGDPTSRSDIVKPRRCLTKLTTPRVSGQDKACYRCDPFSTWCDSHDARRATEISIPLRRDTCMWMGRCRQRSSSTDRRRRLRLVATISQPARAIASFI